MSSQLILQPDSDAGIDAYIGSGANATSNFGSAAVLAIGTTFVGKSALANRTVLRFDVSSLPAGASILAATMTLFHAPGGAFSGESASFSANRLTQPNWTEFGVTFLKYDGSNTWSTAGGDYTTTDQATALLLSPTSDLVFPVLANLVSDALVNRGGLLHLLVLGPEGGSVNNYFVARSSDDSTASTRPKLVIDYDPPSPRAAPNFSGGMQELTGNLGA